MKNIHFMPTGKQTVQTAPGLLSGQKKGKNKTSGKDPARFSARIECLTHAMYGQTVSNCIILRKDANGQFYFVTVYSNGNYGDKVLTPSAAISHAKTKIISSINFWDLSGFYDNGEELSFTDIPAPGKFPRFYKTVYFDYAGAKKIGQIVW